MIQCKARIEGLYSHFNTGSKLLEKLCPLYSNIEFVHQAEAAQARKQALAALAMDSNNRVKFLVHKK